MGMTEISIPSSVGIIGDNAFAYCQNLNEVYFYGDAPTEIGESVFDNCDENLKLYYLADSDGWNDSLLNEYDMESFIPVSANKEISGSITSFGLTTNLVTINLYDCDGTLIDNIETDDDEYMFSVSPGEYILEIRKKDHVTRTYIVTVSDGDVLQDVKICLKGDVTEDGFVRLADYMKIKQHAQNVNLLW